MKTFGRYLSYRLEKSVMSTLVLAVLSLLLTNFTVREELTRMYSPSRTGLYILAVVLGIACTLIPLMESDCFKNRRNLDTLYFLPISRFKLALAHYLSGWIQVMAVYMVSFVWAAICMSDYARDFNLFYLLPYYFLSLLLGLIIYSFFMFLFGEGNTSGDGLAFCLLGAFALLLIFCAINEVWWKHSKSFLFDSEWGLVYIPLNNLTVLFQNKIHLRSVSDFDLTNENPIRAALYMFALWGVIGVASAIGYFVTFVRKGAEKIGDISDSWFGYKTMIPLYAYLGFFLLGIQGIIGILIFILTLVGYFIYRRSFRLKKSDLISIAFCLIPIAAHWAFM
ncbi:MAG: hypothetical protein IJX19_02440 [Clostridia bacterium]|nr:hypothetical protein [Clostridia bacterium]